LQKSSEASKDEKSSGVAGRLFQLCITRFEKKYSLCVFLTTQHPCKYCMLAVLQHNAVQSLNSFRSHFCRFLRQCSQFSSVQRSRSWVKVEGHTMKQ